MSASKTIKVTIPVEQFVTWTDPVNQKVQHANFYVKARNLLEGLPREKINTRPQNIKQKFYRGVVQSAIFNTQTFHHQNNGMHVFVRKFTKNGKNVTLYLGQNDGIGGWGT